MPSHPARGASTAGGVRHLDDARRGGAGAAPGRPPPGMLAMSIQRRGGVVELRLSGDLDMATAPRLREAMVWLRFGSDPTTTIVIDTSDIEFVAAAGYRALQAALVGPNGLWDPRVVLVVGSAVARLEAAVAATVADRRGMSGR
jgi:anti-anti-sigma factor